MTRELGPEQELDEVGNLALAKLHLGRQCVRRQACHVLQVRRRCGRNSPQEAVEGGGLLRRRLLLRRKCITPSLTHGTGAICKHSAVKAGAVMFRVEDRGQGSALRCSWETGT